MIGTTDQSCWLAEACEILLLHLVDVSGSLALTEALIGDITAFFPVWQLCCEVAVHFNQ